MAVEKNNKGFLKKILIWENALLVDILAIVFFLSLNLVYLFPFLGQADGGNFFSAPLVPKLASFLAVLSGLPVGQAMTLCLLVFIIFGPVSLYLLVAKLSGRRLAAFAAGLIYSLPLEILAVGRVKMAFLVGDGGHIAALTLVPVVIFFLLGFLKEGKFGSLVVGSLVLGIIALMSPFAFLSAGMVSTVAAFSEFLQGKGRLKFLRFLFFLAFSAGFIAFWYNPAFVVSFWNSAQGQAIKKSFFNLVPISFVVVPIMGAFGFLLFEKRAHLQALFIALGLVVLFSLISFADYIGQLFPSHPHRYLSELGFSFSFLAGVGLVYFSDYIRFNGRFFKIRLTPLGRKMANKVLWFGFFSTGLLAIFISLRSFWQLPESQVLGAWNEGITAGGWEIRRQAGGILAVLGNLITYLTIFLGGFLWLKIKKNEKSTG